MKNWLTVGNQSMDNGGSHQPFMALRSALHTVALVFDDLWIREPMEFGAVAIPPLLTKVGGPHLRSLFAMLLTTREKQNHVGLVNWVARRISRAESPVNASKLRSARLPGFPVPFDDARSNHGEIGECLSPSTTIIIPHREV